MITNKWISLFFTLFIINDTCDFVTLIIGTTVFVAIYTGLALRFKLDSRFICLFVHRLIDYLVVHI